MYDPESEIILSGIDYQVAAVDCFDKHHYMAARIGTDIRWWQCADCGRLKQWTTTDYVNLDKVRRAWSQTEEWHAGWRAGYLAGSRDAYDDVAEGS